MDNVRRVEVDPQRLQPDTMNGNRKEASGRRGTGILVTWVSEEKRVQPRQGHSELRNIVIVQFEVTPTVAAADRYFQMDEVPKCLNYGGEGGIDDGNREVSDPQGL